MSSEAVIMSGRLMKNNQKYIIRHISSQDVADVYELHKVILANLRPGQECFIHHKKMSDFQRMVDNPDNLFIGTFVDGKLVGYASANFVNENNIDDVLPDFALDYEPNRIAVLEQASVNPEYRGNNLASIMNSVRQKVAYQQYHKKYAVTMVDIKNFYSYRNGFRNGMCITQATVDPDDGGHVIYMAKEIGKEVNFNVVQIPQELSYAEMDIENVSRLIEQGYVARGYDDSRQKVLFNKTNDFKYKNKTLRLESNLMYAAGQYDRNFI
ncbi:MAG: GNAT family N-acetyltransferase [Alphaproteobacteria bacterium]|nr:GNAT family N-acetyltransferase [Alphaproteobacteria bacterium]